MNLTKTKIKDIQEFCKLFKVNIPVGEEFSYYIETLKKSDEFEYPGRSIQDNIDLFIELEEYITTNGFESVRAYKNKCMDDLVLYIKNSESYINLQSAELPAAKLESKDLMNQIEEFDTMLSLDFQSANYSILKTFEPDGKNELGRNWTELCNKFNIHKCLIKSKSFRQIVFGNTNPKRLQTFQHHKVLELVNYMKNVCKYTDDKFVFISHDEIIIKVKAANNVISLIDIYLDSMEKLVEMPIKSTVFSMKKIKKNVFVKTIYSINPISDNSSNYYFSENYKTLHGVPGHKFYMYFKKYILNQAIDELDLMYYNDDELCKWVDEDAIKAKKDGLPHYEKPQYVISIKKAKEDYSFIWNDLGIVLPKLTDEEKRRIVEVIANTCRHCYQKPAGCQCWKND